MLFGFEGNPRSGKSHDIVRVHILENLRKGRKIYARLNGLNHSGIAEYLGVPVEYVQEHLIALSETQVREWFRCDTADNGSVTFPHFDRGSLIIVDECHAFWPVGRAELPPHVAEFFAKHGHWGLDIVVATQELREVHRTVIRRMQKKTVVTKLDVLGADRSYSVRYMAASSPGKFEQVGVEKRTYDPAIWSLYHGVDPGVETNEPYKVGTITLWRSLRWPAFAMGVLLLAGIFFLVRFFVSPEATIESVSDAPLVSPASASLPSAPAPSPPVNAAPAAPPKPPKIEYPAPVQYIIDIKGDARPRYAGSIGDRHILEFRESGGDDRAIERLDSEQLRQMGFDITPTRYGLIAQFRDVAIIFTPWPLEPRFEQSQRTSDALARTPLISNLSPPTSSPPLVSSDAEPAAAGTSFGSIHAYGDIGVK